VAALAGGEQETRAARLQSFFASLLSGLFGQGEVDGESEEEMATRNHNTAAAAAPQLQHNRGEPPANFGSLLCLSLFVLSSGDGFLFGFFGLFLVQD
jgi:hypothetical protein